MFEHIFRLGYSYFRRDVLEDGESTVKEIDLPYYHFIQSNKKTGFLYFLDKNINLERIDFENATAQKKHAEAYKGFTYGKRNPLYSYIYEQNCYDTEQVNSRIWYFDIEVGALDAQDKSNQFPRPEEVKLPVTLIQVYDNILKKYLVFSLKDFSTPYDDITEKIICSDECQLLTRFCRYIDTYNPFIFAGWNIYNFDIPYLVNRMKVLELNFQNLSKFGKVTIESKNYGGKNIYNHEWAGHVLIDMLDTYKKFTYTPRDSYSLNNISRVELGDEKVSYDEYDSLSDLYHSNINLFVEYGIKDVELLVALEKKLKIIDIQKMLAKTMQILIPDALGTVRPWGVKIYNECYSRNLIPPNDSTGTGKMQFV